jgi:hypothetical protein
VTRYLLDTNVISNVTKPVPRFEPLHLDQINSRRLELAKRKRRVFGPYCRFSAAA